VKAMSSSLAATSSTSRVATAVRSSSPRSCAARRAVSYIARNEVFGPVLTVIEIDSFEDAIDTVNDCEYGLSAAIYTRDVNQAMRAVHAIDTGIVYVNAPTIGAEIHLPFGARSTPATATARPASAASSSSARRSRCTSTSRADSRRPRSTTVRQSKHSTYE